METFALILVLLGSLLHLGWNIFAKKARNGFVFLWICSFPLAAWGLYDLVILGNWLKLDLNTKTCIILSALIHARYFWTLSKSYEVADLGFVYPVCRSVGNVVAVVLGICLLSETPSFWGYLGMSICILVPTLEPFYQLKFSPVKMNFKTVWLTLETGLLIGAYLFVDKVGSKEISAFKYLIYFITPTFFMMAAVIFSKPMKNDLLKENLWHILWGTLFWSSAYGVVIWSMKIAPVSYVSSARASGIVMSALAGKVFFGETLGSIRIVSVILIMIGVVLMTF